MARIFGKTFGRGGLLAQARAAELRGELAQAAALFAQAGRPDEVARVMVLRGDAEADPATRLRHYHQALATAPEGSSVRAHARRRHAHTVLAMSADSPMTGPLRRELARAAAELEAVEDYAHAAEAHARTGDVEGQARALARSGDIEALDALLVEEQRRDRDAIARRQARDEVALLSLSGRRREAAAMARASADDTVREQGNAIELGRVASSLVNIVLRGKPLALALGDEIVIGRAPPDRQTEGAGPERARVVGVIAVASAAVSRSHLAVARRDGKVFVRDLGSRNATLLRGLTLTGEAPVGDGLELRLGREVPLVVRPTGELAGAVAIELPGMRCIAALGPAMLGVGRWRVVRGQDGWAELLTDDAPPAFTGSLRLAAAVTLLAGDVMATERAGEPVLEVVARGG